MENPSSLGNCSRCGVKVIWGERCSFCNKRRNDKTIGHCVSCGSSSGFKPFPYQPNMLDEPHWRHCVAMAPRDIRCYVCKIVQGVPLENLTPEDIAEFKPCLTHFNTKEIFSKQLKQVIKTDTDSISKLRRKLIAGAAKKEKLVQANADNGKLTDFF